MSVAFYAAGAFLIRPALWTSGVMTGMLTLCAALVFHALFILAMTRIIHACAGTRKRDLPGA